MLTRIALISVAVATALTGAGFAFNHTSPGIQARAAVSMRVDARASRHATLLPTVRVFADASQPHEVATAHFATTEALPVTLLPAVHVSAGGTDLATISTIVAPTMTTMRTHAPLSAEAAVVAKDAGPLARTEMRPINLTDATPALRTRMLSR